MLYFFDMFKNKESQIEKFLEIKSEISKNVHNGYYLTADDFKDRLSLTHRLISYFDSKTPKEVLMEDYLEKVREKIRVYEKNEKDKIFPSKEDVDEFPKEKVREKIRVYEKNEKDKIFPSKEDVDEFLKICHALDEKIEKEFPDEYEKASSKVLL